MHSTNKDGSKLHILSLFLSLFFLDSYFIFGTYSGNILISSDAYSLYIYMLLSLNLLYVFSLMTFGNSASFYILSYISFYIIGAEIITGTLYSDLLLSVSLLLLIISIKGMNVSNKITKFISLWIVILFMTYIGKTVTFIYQPVPAPLTIENLIDRISAIGLPLPITEKYGLFISTQHADFIISPLQFFLLMSVSSLLVENYHKIIRLLFKNDLNRIPNTGKGSGLLSAGYAVVAAMSCQCESAIALLPAVTILLINLLLLPFFILSVSLLILTYIFITLYYERHKVPNFLNKLDYPKKNFFIAIISSVLVTQLFIPIGVLFNLQESPFFLFGFGMLMILEGFVIFFIISPAIHKIQLNGIYSILIFILATLIALMWFLPSFTSVAVRSPVFFSSMTYSMTLSGFLIGLIYHFSMGRYGIGILEIYTVTLGIIPIVIYYYTFSLNVKIWNFWSISEQSELALVLWLIMLPIMWIVTQKSLSHPIYELKL